MRLFLIALILTVRLGATSYYVNASTGLDSNNGTSSATPWQTFTPVNTHTFTGGDNLYLACGSTWNQQLLLTGAGASWSSFILVAPYGSGAAPKISMSSGINERAVKMTDCDYWQLQGLEICNTGSAIMVYYTTLSHHGLRFESLYIHDVNVVNNGSPTTSDGLSGSSGIRIQNDSAHTFSTLSSSQFLLRDVRIENCIFNNVVAPWVTDLALTSGLMILPYSYRDIFIAGNQVTNVGWDMGAASCTNETLVGNYCYNAATVAQSQGTAAVFSGASSQLSFINNVFDTVPHVGSTDECWIDFEVCNDQSRVFSNYFTNSAGAAIEYLQLDNDFGITAGSNYCTNNSVDGNLFVSVGATLNHGAVWAYNPNGNTISGTLTNNIYYVPSTSYTVGSVSGLPSTNDSPNVPANVYNAATQLSSTQGAGAWTYQYQSGSAWNNFATYTSASRSWSSGGETGTVGYACLLPEASASKWVSYTWTAPGYGFVSIRGRVLRQQLDGSNAVSAKILLNHTQVWPSGGSAQSISAGDVSGYNTHLDWLNVAAGDALHFAVNVPSGDNSNALVSWNPSVVFAATYASGRQNASP